MLDVYLLGCGGTMPLKDRRLTSAAFRYNGSCLVIDCGEGTQIGYKDCDLRFKALDVICFTHYHADHVSGIIGMLLSMGNEGRTETVHMIGPRGLTKVINSLRIIAPELPFEIEFHEIENKYESFSISGFEIDAFQVKHRIICYGYRIHIPRKGKFDAEKAKALPIPVNLWNKIQKEGSVEYEGKLYTEDMVMGPARKGISVVYCTDTRPVASISDYAYEADLLICEGMYGEDEKKSKAIETGHMLMSEAAELAAGAYTPPKKLWLTHFSTSLNDPGNYLEATRSIFPDTELGSDGKSLTIDFEE